MDVSNLLHELAEIETLRQNALALLRLKLQQTTIAVPLDFLIRWDVCGFVCKECGMSNTASILQIPHLNCDTGAMLKKYYHE